VAGGVTRALLDTSILIADAEVVARVRGQTAAISVITIGELRAGTRAARQARLAAVRTAFEPLVVDEAVAEHYGEVLAKARSERRTSKATDLLIIATAAATGRVLHTLDAAQAQLARAAGIPTQP
jgi:predicted nucleic acid-binding protein